MLTERLKDFEKAREHFKKVYLNYLKNLEKRS